MTDPDDAAPPRLTRRGALKAALYTTAALAAGLGPSGADPLPVPNERAMPPAGAPDLPPTAPVLAVPGGRGAGGPFHLPPLPYAYDALEPFIDAQTMRLHHDGHHAAYVQNLNAVFPKLGADQAVGPPDASGLVADLLTRPHISIPDPNDPVYEAIRNNGGGHYNHSLFWQTMRPTAQKGGGRPTADLAGAIDNKFGSLSAFQEQFTRAALGQFGSGWAWLSLTRSGALGIESAANQDSPLMLGRTPLLGLDVWEHAYYLKYQNRRAEYVAAWFHTVNWDFVNARYDAARKAG